MPIKFNVYGTISALRNFEWDTTHIGTINILLNTVHIHRGHLTYESDYVTF